MHIKRQPRDWVYRMMGGSFLLFFFLSSLRHFLLKSNAYDLGWFDQMVYLISQGKPPIVSFSGYHLLGDHVAVILYGIAPLYQLYATVYWLVLLQAIALSLGCWGVWKLSRQAGLTPPDSGLLSAVYLLYPLVFNINLYDFHPEVLAIPAFFAAVYTARKGQLFLFTLCVVFILSCKAVLSLTVAAMGVWLFGFENRRLSGGVAFILGVTWFLLTTQVIIPQFSGAEQAAVSRYAYLGDSVTEIIVNLFRQPQLVLGQVFSGQTLEYFALLFLPVFWGLHPVSLTPLVAAIPALGINILSEEYVQRNLVSQYSVPILPFLMLSLIAAWSKHKIWVTNKKFILLWSILGFLVLAKYTYFATLYLSDIDRWKVQREVLSLVSPKTPILAPSHLNPHLSHREVIKLPFPTVKNQNLEALDSIILDINNPGFGSDLETINRLRNYLEENANFQLKYNKKGVQFYRKFD